MQARTPEERAANRAAQCVLLRFGHQLSDFTKGLEAIASASALLAEAAEVAYCLDEMEGWLG